MISFLVTVNGMILDFGKFSNMDILRENVCKVEKEVETYLANLTKHELNRKVEVPRRSTPTYLLSIEDNSYPRRS